MVYIDCFFFFLSSDFIFFPMLCPYNTSFYEWKKLNFFNDFILKAAGCSDIK